MSKSVSAPKVIFFHTLFLNNKQLNVANVFIKVKFRKKKMCIRKKKGNMFPKTC